MLYSLKDRDVSSKPQPTETVGSCHIWLVVDYYYLLLLYCAAACYLLLLSSQNLLHKESNQITLRAFYEIFGSNSQEENSRHKSEICTISSNNDFIFFHRSFVDGCWHLYQSITGSGTTGLLKTNHLVWHSALVLSICVCSSSTLHPMCFHQWVCCVSHSFSPFYLPAKLPMTGTLRCCYTYLFCTNNSAVMVLDMIFFHSTSPDVEDNEVSGTSFACMIICSAIDAFTIEVWWNFGKMQIIFKAVTVSSGHAPWWEGKCGTVQAR